MGRAHSNAWRQAPRFFDLPADVRMAVLCGRDAAATREAAAKLGWENAATDWRAVVDDARLDALDICTPNDLHAEIAIAAARAGKAIICEKPLARNLREALQMVGAVKSARVTNMLCHNYRRVPAIALARQMIERGEMGKRVYHFRARYAQDWIADENFPLVWRLQADKAGSGALGDLGAHIVDLARFLVGEIDSISALSSTFIKKRRSKPGGALRTVDVDDAFCAIGKFRNGALLNLEATRFARGRKNHLSFEINGSGGSIVFDLEKMNRLRFFDRRDRAHAHGFRDIIVTEPSHPYLENWWPPGHLLGYEHSVIHTVADFVCAVVSGKRVRPDFEDGFETQRVLDAIQRSGAQRGKPIRVSR